MDRTAAPCLTLFMMAFSVGIVKQSLENIETGPALPAAASAVVAKTTEYGAMILCRAGMASFTACCVISEACNLEDLVSATLGPLSGAAAMLHIWISAEHALSRSVVGHYLVHVSSAVFRLIRSILKDDLGETSQMVFYLLMFYPALYVALTRFRASVRSHGDASAAKLARMMFLSFWSTLAPAQLYLMSDSLGMLS